MCCLFGLIDTRLRFTGKQKSKMLHALATVSELRGTDATGIAYHTGEQLCIYKRPIPGHKLKFYMRDDTRVGMGHTRMTTQGKASKNRNNHPFRGIVRNEPFALAHNGVLYNDLALRRKLGLPKPELKRTAISAFS
ncbi:MAG: class II glutamine amidotransferase [Dysosmobacter welbionis]